MESKKRDLLTRAKIIKFKKRHKEFLKARSLVENKALKLLIDQELKRDPNNSNFSSFIDDINSEDRFRKHAGVIGLRKLLCQEQNPPIQRALDAGVIPKLIEFAQLEHEPQLILEAIWNITNIASGSHDQTIALIQKGAIIYLVKKLKHPNLKIAEQAIWALGNIAGDSSNLRDAVLKWGAIYPLIKCLNKANKVQIIKHGAWMLSNLCRGRPLPKLSFVEAAVEPLCTIFKISSNNETLAETAWALANLLDNASLVDRFLATGASFYLINHLKNPQMSVLTPCLRAVGNIVSGSDLQTEGLLSNPDLIPMLMMLITNPRMSVRREVGWILSNIVASRNSYYLQILGNPHYFQQILMLVYNDVNDVKREALWIFGNAFNKPNSLKEFDKHTQIKMLESFIFSLDNPDKKALSVSLEGIKCMLSQENKNQEGEKTIFQALQEPSVREKISNFQQHLDPTLSNNAKKIMITLNYS